MAKGKVRSIFVKLLSGAGTGFFYVTRKNPKNVPERLTLRKYDPVVVSQPALPNARPRAHATPPPLAFKPSRPHASASPHPRRVQT
jgi:large subunit ribosomal protein L33